MTDLVTVLIGGLITWRVAIMFVRENGPVSVFARLRAYLASKQKRMGGFFDMISCVACISVYVAAVTAVAPAGNALEWLGYTLAFSAVATLTEALAKKLT